MLTQIVVRTTTNLFNLVLIAKLTCVSRINLTHFDFKYIGFVENFILYQSTLEKRLFHFSFNVQMGQYKRPYA